MELVNKGRRVGTNSVMKHYIRFLLDNKLITDEEYKAFWLGDTDPGILIDAKHLHPDRKINWNLGPPEGFKPLEFMDNNNKNPDEKVFEWEPIEHSKLSSASEPPSYKEVLDAGRHVARAAILWRHLAIIGWLTALFFALLYWT